MTEQARQIFTILRAANPQPTTELIYTSGFELLVAVILSAQATDVGVNKATAKLFAVANTPQLLAALGVAELEGYIKTLGLYKVKARNLSAMARLVLTKYQGEVPATRHELQELPGVGRKTANVILNTLYQQPTMAVDTHIFRVANRLGLASATTVTAVEQALLEVIPAEFMLNAHHWLILHGRYVCKARKPECARCSIKDYCAYVAKNL